MIEKILCVDDNPNILAANKRQFRKEFHIETALGGEEGLEAIDNQGPFAVIVADMQMPIMDGVQFLALVRERAPDSVRMMLTGYANLQTALDFDKLIAQGLSHKAALSRLRGQLSMYNPEVVAALENLLMDEVIKGERIEDITVSDPKVGMVADEDIWIENITVSDIKVGMIADEDIRSKSGLLLMPKGQEVTSSALARLRNFSRVEGIAEPVRMRITYYTYLYTKKPRQTS